MVTFKCLKFEIQNNNDFFATTVESLYIRRHNMSAITICLPLFLRTSHYTRHEMYATFKKKIATLCPPSLNVCHFVRLYKNSVNSPKSHYDMFASLKFQGICDSCMHVAKNVRIFGKCMV